MTQREFDEALERIREITGKRTQVDLAAVLNIRQSSISDAKRRRSVPAEWLVRLLRQYGTNPDWVLTGLGARSLRPADGSAPAVMQDLGMVPDAVLLNEVAARMGKEAA